MTILTVMLISTTMFVIILGILLFTLSATKKSPSPIEKNRVRNDLRKIKEQIEEE